MTTPPDPFSSRRNLSPAFVAAVLAALVVWVYGPAFHAEFVDYDDPLYVTENEWLAPGVSRDALRKVWTEHVAGNWHPVTMVSHLMDVALFGLDPRGHHAVSLLIHAFNTAALFFVLRRLFGGLYRPALAALLFALHPFSVDSAVWISQRKNLLSTFFWLTATLCYLRFVAKPTLTAMLSSLGLFALGLMSKPMLVTFPLTLLLLDFRPLRRVAGFSRPDWPVWSRLIQEKSGFFILVIVFTAFTLMTQFPEGYEHTSDPHPAWARMLFALQHYQMYLEKFFWPSGFSVFYPRLEMPPNLVAVTLAGGLLLAITAAALLLLRRAPALMVGWLWFIGTMFPVIGIVGIGQHSITDRYMYVPMIGLIIAVVWTWPTPQTKTWRRIGEFAGIGAVIVCGVITRSLLPHWQNTEALYRRAIAVTHNNYVMLSNLGRQMILQNNIEEGMALFEQALAINPNHVKTLNNLGFALALGDKHGEAIPYYERAIRLDPRYGTARINLARSLMQERRYRDALEHYEILMKSFPESPDVREGWRRCRQALGLPAGWMP